MKQILVARGTGTATSTVIDNAIERTAEEHDTKVDIRQIEVTEVEPYRDTTDLLVTAAMIKKEYKFPTINARSFPAGIGIGEAEQQVSTGL